MPNTIAGLSKVGHKLKGHMERAVKFFAPKSKPIIWCGLHRSQEFGDNDKDMMWAIVVGWLGNCGNDDNDDNDDNDGNDGNDGKDGNDDSDGNDGRAI